ARVPRGPSQWLSASMSYTPHCPRIPHRAGSTSISARPSLPFAQGHGAIGRAAGKHLRAAVRPGYRDGVHLTGLAQADMSPGRAAGEIAVARVDEPQILLTAAPHPHFRAIGIALERR